MKKSINIALIVIIMLYSFKIEYKYFQYYRDSKSYTKIKEITEITEIEPTVELPVPENLDNQENSKDKKLKDVNSDYKWWIDVLNTDINYPVVQGKDNEFYLHNNFYKEESVAGSIFIDYRNDINSDKNIVLYGHNMKDNTMFTQINKYKEVKNFNNGIIKILNNNKEYIYEVFSVFVLDGNNNNLKIGFTSEEDYINYIKFLKEKSIYTKTTEDTTYSNIITQKFRI